MIPWVICEWLKFYNAGKCDKHKCKSLEENEIHNVLWDWDTNGSPDIHHKTRFRINKKKTWYLVDFTVQEDDWIKMKSEKIDTFLKNSRKLRWQ